MAEMTHSINDIVDYVYCPVKYFMNKNCEELPDRIVVRQRLDEKTPEFVKYLTKEEEKDEGSYRRLAKEISEGLLYLTKATDLTAIKNMYEAIEGFLNMRRVEVTGKGSRFTVNYGKYTVESYYDLVTIDPNTGKKYPTLIDYSNTKHEAEYNPISYRAITCTDYFGVKDTKTRVKVITISNSSYWEFNHTGYKAVMGSSIEDILRAIDLEIFPMRFGWWCSGCHWRGMCHKMIEVKNR